MCTVISQISYCIQPRIHDLCVSFSIGCFFKCVCQNCLAQITTQIIIFGLGHYPCLPTAYINSIISLKKSQFFFRILFKFLFVVYSIVSTTFSFWTLFRMYHIPLSQDAGNPYATSLNRFWNIFTSILKIQHGYLL